MLDVRSQDSGTSRARAKEKEAAAVASCKAPPKLFSVDDCDHLSIQDVHQLYRKHVNPTRVELLKTFDFGNDLAARAEGVWIYTRSGKKILDFTGGIGVLNHGHNHPRILAARKKFQDLQKMEVHRNFFSPYVAALSHNIASLLPEDLQYCFFPNSGSEAVDAALKTALKYHGGKRETLLYSDIAFHGKLLGPASVTNSPENSFPYPKIPGTRSFAYNDIESVKNEIERSRNGRGECTVAGIIVEPMNVSNLRVCSSEFLFALREICSQENIVLIFDEIYSGWGKTGSLFYFMRMKGLVPDVLCMAKSFGGGKASISGVVTRKPVFEKAFDNVSSANLQTSTFSGFGEETITAVESINILVQENLVERSEEMGKHLHSGLLALQEKYPNVIAGVAGTGCLQGVFFRSGPQILNQLVGVLPGEIFKDARFMEKLVTSAVIQELYSQHQILTFMSLGEDIYLIAAPSLVVKREEVDQFLTALDKVFSVGLPTLLFRFVITKLKQ